MDRGIRPWRGLPLFAIAAAALVALLAPSLASAHVERPSYWPDPAADTSVAPAAGGKVPKARPLSTALKASPPGDTRVVCQKNSLTLARKAIARALERGYDNRPSDPKKLSQSRADRLLTINEQFRARCRFKHIQDAVTASRNNDRVVIMPGTYTEPKSRATRTFDPACDKYEINTEFGDPGALSYAYQFNCPNDQNLIAVMGREVGTGQDPDPPRRDRHGIPNLGPCIRCNLQIEGSGVSADDVIVDAGRVESGNGAPIEPKKDVAIRADRADGFVLRSVNVRHAKEHGIYVLESDGYLLDRFKAFYNGLYGTLTFVEDHGIQQHCETAGHADSGIYPGAPVESGVQRPEGTPFRYNQTVRFCDSYHNLAGYSATDGNAVRVHDNNFYGNALGLNTDVVTAAGHPGFPGDSSLFEQNNIYSNNFDIYDPSSDVKPAFPYPSGTGLWIAGGNHHVVRNNNIYDNWRRGTMVFGVPDSLICGPQTNNHDQAGCDPNGQSTSHFNRQYSNVMGRSPDGKSMPNGTDFWWDDFPNNRGNCWFQNDGPKPITNSPRPLPSCDDGRNPDSSIGIGNPVNEGELISCLAAFETRNFDRSTTTCPWLTPPQRPGSSAARVANGPEQRERMRRAFYDFCEENPSSGTCKPFERLLRER